MCKKKPLRASTATIQRDPSPDDLAARTTTKDLSGKSVPMSTIPRRQSYFQVLEDQDTQNRCRHDYVGKLESADGYPASRYYVIQIRCTKCKHRPKVNTMVVS